MQNLCSSPFSNVCGPRKGLDDEAERVSSDPLVFRMSGTEPCILVTRRKTNVLHMVHPSSTSWVVLFVVCLFVL